MPSHTALLAVLIVCSALVPVLSGPAYKPKSTLTGIDVWTNANTEWFEYPEASASSNYYVDVANARPNFGIAVSGGGLRPGSTLAYSSAAAAAYMHRQPCSCCGQAHYRAA